jgi:chromosome segregation ATPase
MASKSLSFRANQAGLDELRSTVEESYSNIAQLIYKLDAKEDTDLIAEARNICARLEEIIELLDEEENTPELGIDALEGGVEMLVSEAESLRSQLRALALKIESKGR